MNIYKCLNVCHLMVAAAFLLASCAVNAPMVSPSGELVAAPETAIEAPSEQVPQKVLPETQSPKKDSAVVKEDAPAEMMQPPSQELPPVAPQSVSVAAQIINDSIKIVDPYVAFPALIQSVFDYAEILYKAGYVDSASAYLERFRVIKPLWNQWASKADSMLNEFGKTRAEKAKAFEPMVMQIQNMNRAKSSYSMVAETADSLIALAPGDSLINWAKGQKNIALAHTLQKAKKERAAVKAMADNQAQFAEAENQANDLLIRYRDFEDSLQIQALIDYVRNLADAADISAAEYWKSNDPEASLTKADTLLLQEKFGEAKVLLNKLKLSKLRKEANERYVKLADAYCTKQRKTTSQIFAAAQKQKDFAKKQKLLQEAIESLDKCLAEYPDNSQKQIVLENKKFLQQELAK